MRLPRFALPVAGAALLAALSARSAAAQAAASPRPAGAPVALDPRTLMAAADKGRIMGSESAKLWIVVFSDFECPYCKRWHDQTDETIRRDYVQTGKVRLAFLNFPLTMHPQAQPAAEAAMCAAAQGKFWPYHDGLFAAQTRWAKGGDPSAAFDSLATATGADVTAFRACRSLRSMKLLVESDRARGMQAGAQGTPYFYVGTQVLSGAVPTADFVKAIEAELAKAGGR